MLPSAPIQSHFNIVFSVSISLVHWLYSCQLILDLKNVHPTDNCESGARLCVCVKTKPVSSFGSVWIENGISVGPGISFRDFFPLVPLHVSKLWICAKWKLVNSAIRCCYNKQTLGFHGYANVVIIIKNLEYISIWSEWLFIHLYIKAHTHTHIPYIIVPYVCYSCYFNASSQYRRFCLDVFGIATSMQQWLGEHNQSKLDPNLVFFLLPLIMF